MTGHPLGDIVRGNNAEFIDGRLCLGRKSVANGFDVAHGLEKAIGLIKVGELFHLGCLIGGGNGIEVIRNEIEGYARLVILVVEKVFEVVGVDWQGQRQAHELGVWLNFLHGEHHFVIKPCVGLGINVVLEVDFIQNLPVRD